MVRPELAKAAQVAWLRAFDPARVVAKPCTAADLVRVIRATFDGDAVE